MRFLALSTAAVLLPCCSTDIGTGDEPSQVTTRVSQRKGDIEVRAFSSGPYISGTGRYVAFTSTADDLFPGADINGKTDVYLKDRTDGSVFLLSIRDPGGQADQDATAYGVSDDGNRVVFVSLGDFNGLVTTHYNVFVRDRASGRTIRMTGSVEPSHDCFQPSISSDGRYVAFQTAANNIGFGAPTSAQIILAELPPTYPAFPAAVANPTLTLVSRSTVNGTTACNGFCTDASIVGAGPAVCFYSDATNLPIGVAVVGGHCYYAVPNPTTPNSSTVELVSRADGVAGAPITGGMPTASTDGRYIAFETTAAAVDPIRIAVRDRTTGTTTSAFDEHYGGGLIPSHYPRISGSGRFVVWWGGVSPLAPNPNSQCYLRDMNGGFELLSVDTFGAVSDSGATFPAMSTDERWVVFTSSSGNLVVGDTNGVADIFVRGPRY